MTAYFKEATTVDELRKQYRELLKKYHPDNQNGSLEITKEINTEYDRLFAILSKEKKSATDSATYDEWEENKAFKEVLNHISHINAEVEVIGSWIWVHGGYEYRNLLKEVGFNFAPIKKCWCWHHGTYINHHRCELSLDEIRIKYGSQNVNHKSKQYAIS